MFNISQIKTPDNNVYDIKAVGLKESPRLTDTTPYLFRPSFANGYGYETLIGGTCGVNQLVYEPDVWTSDPKGFKAGVSFVTGHKLLMIVGGTANDSFKAYVFGNVGGTVSIFNSGIGSTIISCPFTFTQTVDGAHDTNNSTWIWIDQFASWSNGYINIIDLTQMFGTTIADYVYTLESGTSGAGVAWLKNNGFFSADYYPYNAGGLLSVKTSKKINRGFNQFDELWESGTINQTTGAEEPNAYIDRFENYIPIVPNTRYYFKYTANNDIRIFYYDANKNYIGTIIAYANNSFVSPVNACYIRGTHSNADGHPPVCINISCGLDGQYQPYVSHEYPLDDIELRGILKLDGNNSLYYDGDTYESNGSVTRKYGIVDLGTLDYAYYGGRFNTVSAFDDIGGEIVSDCYVNVICAKYVNSSSNTDKTFFVYNNKYIYIYDSAYTDATAFKNSLDGVYLVYELSTISTETADAFTNPMVVDGNGTEEFVDGRTVEMPVGHSTIYVDNSDKTKLDSLPDISNDGDGTYVINQENGKQSLVTPNATDISYSNTSSGLTATKVQGAIDEVNTKVGTKANSSDVYTKSNTYNKTEVNSMLTLVKSATSGNPCTFTTDLADALVSLTANIVCGGGGGTPSTPIPLVGHSALNLDVNGDTFTVQFGQTVYGGVYDKSGRLTITHGIVSFADLSTKAWNVSGSGIFYLYPTAMALPNILTPIVNNPICSHFVYQGSGTMENNTFRVSDALYIKSDIVSTIADLRIWLSNNNGVIAYELATPIVIDVPSISVFAENGVNNIVSDCGGDIAVEYEVGDLANDVKTVISNTKLADLSDIPNPPTTDGNYRLIVTITDGKPIYSWEEITE